MKKKINLKMSCILGKMAQKQKLNKKAEKIAEETEGLQSTEELQEKGSVQETVEAQALQDPAEPLQDSEKTEKSKNKLWKMHRKKNETKKKRTLKSSPIQFKNIASKIILSFGVAVALMAVCVVFFAIRVNSFNAQYEEVVSNLKKINYIRENSETQTRRFTTLCIGRKDIAESGEDVILQTMNEYIAEVEKSIGNNEKYTENRNRIQTIRADLDAYTAIVQELFAYGGGTNFPSMDSKATILIESTHQYNGNIASGALDLLVLEIDRSADIQEQISANFRFMIVAVGVIFGLTIFISIVLCLALTRSIVGPVNKLKKEIMLVADGDLSRETLEINSKDEIKALTDAFNSMSDNLKSIINHVSAVADELEGSSKVVSQSIIENERGAEGVSEAVVHMTEQMAAQSAEAESTMNQVREMNNVSERIRDSIDQINDNAVISMEQASDGTALIEEYSSQLGQVNEVVVQAAKLANELTTSTQEMNVILKSITEISSQTKLISLNASIEAARAGEAGRGFAVVATEIGNLANDTQVATSKIAEIIKAVQDDVADMTSSMNTGLEQLQKSNGMANQTKESFKQIADTTSIVSASIEEITSEMQLLADLVEKVVLSMEQMDNSIAANKDSTYDISSLVTEQSANLNNMSTSAQTLIEQAADLHKLLTQFKLV